MHAIALDFSLLRAVPKVRELPEAPDSNARLPDDAELVRRALKGQRWAEEALYRRHVRAVAQLVTRLLARSQEAEDVVQDAFLSVFRDLAELRQADSFRSWVIRIAVRLVHRRFRRRRLLRALGLDREQNDATLSAEVDPSAGPDVQVELSKLDRVLSELPADQRVAWILRVVEGYRLDEVASLCGCSVATAKRRISRAQQRVELYVAVATKDED
jgi:RNA polymerase sigma-70 factor, ECF subfamily